MSKKPPICQVRLPHELSLEVDKQRESFSVRTSRSGFVSYLLKLGLRTHKSLENTQRICDLGKAEGGK